MRNTMVFFGGTIWGVIDDADESDEIETAKLIEAKDKIAMESKPFTKWR